MRALKMLTKYYYPKFCTPVPESKSKNKTKQNLKSYTIAVELMPLQWFDTSSWSTFTRKD